MLNTWLVLLPPCLVLLLGFTTRRVLFSLACGIFTASFIVSDFSLPPAAKLTVNRLWSNTELANLSSLQAFLSSNNLFICIFIFILGIIITFMSHAGGAYAYTTKIRTHITSPRAAEMSSLFLSMLLFVDDYFNSLTVGSVMHTLTDSFKIPRAKLAFLVHSMALPLALMIPVSSWVAAIVGFLQESDIHATLTSSTLLHANPMEVYLSTLPFVFYAIIAFLSTWFIVLRRISFGPMHKHEEMALTMGNLFGGKTAKHRRIKEVHERHAESPSLIDFLVPVLALVICIVGGLLYSGNFYLFGGTQGFIHALQHARAASALFFGGSLLLIFCLGFFLLRGRVSPGEIIPLCIEGIQLMLPSIYVLLLAWTFGDILRKDLHTGQELANLLTGTLPIHFLPLMFFITSLLISFALGSSWGTMAIMFPIAVPMVISFLGLEAPVEGIQSIPLLLPVLGAILAGGIVGDNISPISDTTVMSATSSGAHHIDHVHTQMIYSLPSIFAAGCAFTLSGFLIPYGLAAASCIPLALGTGISFMLLFLCNKKRSSLCNS